MIKNLTSTLALAAIAAAASPAMAAPVAVGLGAFGPSTVIDFNALSDQLLVGNLYAAQGVTVTGGLMYTDNSAAAQAAFGSQGASNHNHALPPASSAWITLSFANPIVRLGMDQFSNGTEFFIEAAGGELLYGTGTSASFVGLEDLAGFSEATLYITSELDPMFYIDNLRFELAETPGGTIPEPGSLALAALALGAAGFARTRRPR
ncbi:PEP-CTERM sorting domain-containing protein [Aquincola agrisoli]|uniref:PEP-CTERM sorting domain-containing protein n=1 Tax=Aquincola sp. GCM10022187 TaxID=3252634 RepID=UPI00366B41BC